MRIIISPAKKMKIDGDSMHWESLPEFLTDAEILYRELGKLSYEELKRLWKCNDAIAALNTERLKNMSRNCQLTPAILAYEGIQYQYMAPGVFTENEFEYVKTHLRILSGFYGILRPFDGVYPYRLEMQAKLRLGEKRDLYAFWEDKIANKLFSETDRILNLASKEYSVCVSKYLTPDTQFISCIFGEERKGKIVEKGTLCKMARGEMVRYMAENRIEDLDRIKNFDRLGFRFSAEHSDGKTFVFLLSKTGGEV